MGVNLNEVEGGQSRLVPGEYLVRVKSYSQKTINDKHAYEFILEADNDEVTKLTIYRTKAALWRYKLFACAAGMSEADMEDVEPDMFLGRWLMVTVEPDKDPQYASVGNKMRKADRGFAPGGEGSKGSSHYGGDGRKRERVEEPVEEEDIPF